MKKSKQTNRIGDVSDSERGCYYYGTFVTSLAVEASRDMLYVPLKDWTETPNIAISKSGLLKHGLQQFIVRLFVQVLHPQIYLRLVLLARSRNLKGEPSRIGEYGKQFEWLNEQRVTTGDNQRGDNKQGDNKRGDNQRVTTKQRPPNAN